MAEEGSLPSMRTIICRSNTASQAGMLNENGARAPCVTLLYLQRAESFLLGPGAPFDSFAYTRINGVSGLRVGPCDTRVKVRPPGS